MMPEEHAEPSNENVEGARAVPRTRRRGHLRNRRGPDRDRNRDRDRDRDHDRDRDRDPGSHASTATASPESKETHHSDPRGSGNPIREAIQQLERIRDSLRQLLQDLNNVLRTLDEVEKQQKASAEEIRSLQRALQDIQRSRRG